MRFVLKRVWMCSFAWHVCINTICVFGHELLVVLLEYLPSFTCARAGLKFDMSSLTGESVPVRVLRDDTSSKMCNMAMYVVHARGLVCL